MLESTRKNISLAFSVLVCVSAGTNYLISITLPQLASKLNLSSTASNWVGIAANIGVYSSGYPIGTAIDKFGVKPLLLFSSFFLFSGYMLVRAIFDGGLEGLYSITGLYGLMLGQFMTGVGSSAALACGANAVARNFEGKARGSLMSLAYSGFGISAFVFAVSTGSILLAAAFIIKTPPLIHQGYKPLAEDGEEGHSTVEEKVVLHGIKLFSDYTFNLLFITLLCLSGCGLMYINNVGSMIVTLSVSSEIPAATRQATLVSLLSVFNCAGRLIAGFSSDFFLHHAPDRYRFNRIWTLVVVSIIFIISQIIALQIELIEYLYLPTLLTGLAYGGLFGIIPILVLELFGVENFSGNNGMIACAPAAGGNLANYLYGRIYDSNSKLPKNVPSKVISSLMRRASAGVSSSLCSLGAACYSTIFYYTIAACTIAFILSLTLAIKPRR